MLYNYRSTFRNFFSKNTTSDELIIYFDHRPLLRTNLKYPKYLPSDTPLPSNSPNTTSTGGSGLYEVHIGKYWDGQLSGVCMSHGLDAGSSIGASSSSASSVGGFIDDPFLNAVRIYQVYKYSTIALITHSLYLQLYLITYKLIGIEGVSNPSSYDSINTSTTTCIIMQYIRTGCAP